jgi:hypothetical protein
MSGWTFWPSVAAACFFLLLRRRRKIPRPINARAATPPITPPTMGPTGVDLLSSFLPLFWSPLSVALALLPPEVIDASVVAGDVEEDEGAAVALVTSDLATHLPFVLHVSG